MRVFHCDQFEVPLPAGHRFPMAKYASLRRRLRALDVLDERELVAAEPAPFEAICTVHDEHYARAFVDGTLEASAQKRIGFPWSRELVKRTLGSVGATLAAVDSARSDGFAGSLAGGTHHARRAEGAGYCVFNDLAVASVSLLDRGLARRILIVDLDVHQGDGTASIFANDERVFTFSMHGARNYPKRKETSDLDVPLADETDDAAFLDALERHLDVAFERSKADFILYQAGVDPLAEDRLGRLALTHAGLFERDRRVFAAARARSLPIVVTLGGGYAEPIELSIEAHVNTYRAAQEVFGSRERPR